MCSTPKMPSTNNVQPSIATPTYADAEVTKASVNEKRRVASLAGRNIKTSSRGLSDSAATDKKELLGS